MEQQNQEQQVDGEEIKVQELCRKGYSQREISQVLQIGLATVNRDISYLRNQLTLLQICAALSFHEPSYYIWVFEHSGIISMCNIKEKDILFVLSLLLV